MRLPPHRLLATALLAATLAACQGQAPTAPASDAATAAPSTAQADAKFAELSKRWLDGWFALNPVTATQVGDHRFDANVEDYSAEGRQRVIDFSRKMLAELDAIDAVLKQFD